MKLLVINCGSSTLKFQLFDIEKEDEAYRHECRLVRGVVERIGDKGRFYVTDQFRDLLKEEVGVPNHGEAVRLVIRWLRSSPFLKSDGIGAVGHRIVHGGAHFTKPVVLEESVLAAIEKVSELAPLHNGSALEAIYKARSELGILVPMVAVFDTAFHRTMPERASEYAIPRDLALRHKIQRYGFHGIAHRYMTEHYAAIVSRPLEKLKLVTLQLGNGCSACAQASGHSVDTSMGLTPLEGLMMGTRCGDVDPSLVDVLARCEAVPVDEAVDWLNKRSGLLGVSGRSHDMRELLKAEKQGDARAALAVEMFCYRVQKYIGAYMAVLGGADAVLFGGGIGENAPAIRSRICSGMNWCGLILDPERNAKAIAIEAKISADAARLDTYVILVDEAAIIAQDTIRCLNEHYSERHR